MISHDIKQYNIPQGILRVVSFEIEGGVTNPTEATDFAASISGQLAGEFIVGLNGRGPVWLFCMLAHAAHPTLAVATFDPRAGYVVTESHCDTVKVGDVIPDPAAA